MNMRENTVRAYLSNHLEHEQITQATRLLPVNVLAAVGMGAGRLAQLLLHWQVATEPEAKALWMRRAWRLLIRRSAKRLSIRNVGPGKADYEILERACLQAMTEWDHPECPACHGPGKLGVRRYELNPGIRVDELTCPECRGSGVKRYSNGDRLKALKLDSMGAWDHRMAVILAEINKRVEEGMTRAHELLAVAPHLW